MYPFAVAVTLVAVFVLAVDCAFASVVPYPAFLPDVSVLPYVIVPITFWFVHSVMLGVIVILFVSKELSPTINSLLLYKASSFILTYK